MPDSPYFELIVSYPFEQRWKDHSIVQSVGDKYLVASGAGFGFREINFNFESEAEASTAIRRLEAASIEVTYWWVLERWRDYDVAVLASSSNFEDLKGHAGLF